MLSVAYPAGEGVTDAGKNLARALLLALLRTQDDDGAGEHGQDPLQVTQLLLGRCDIVRCRGGRVGRAVDRMSVTLSGLRAQDATERRGAECRTRQHDFGDGVRGDPGLVLGAVTIGVEDGSPADQVRANGDGVDRRPLGPTNGRDLGAVS